MDYSAIFPQCGLPAEKGQGRFFRIPHTARYADAEKCQTRGLNVARAKGYVVSSTAIGTLQVRRVVLRNRLNDGWSRIEQAQEAGADVMAWEEFWVSLLREYEACCQQIDAISPIAPITPLQLEGT